MGRFEPGSSGQRERERERERERVFTGKKGIFHPAEMEESIVVADWGDVVLLRNSDHLRLRPSHEFAALQ